MKVAQYLDIQEEIDFFENYRKSLNDFLNAESMNIKISEYMRIVDETKRVEKHIKYLKDEDIK